MYMRLSSQIALIMSLSWLLVGCQGGPLALPGNQSSEVISFLDMFKDRDGFSNPETLVMRARSSPSPQREEYLLQAVEAYYTTGRIDSGDTLLIQLQPTNQMDINLQGKWVMLRSKMAARQRDWLNLEHLLITDAFGAITNLPLLDDTVQTQLIELRAQLYEGTSRHLKAIKERIYLHHALEDAAKQYNNNQIWSNLQRLPQEKINDRSHLNATKGLLPGWIQLAYGVQQHPTSILNQQQAIQHWQNKWSGHPAIEHLPTSLALLLDFRPADVKQIAALLPQSGPYQQIADAIQKGIMASYYTDDNTLPRKPKIVLYDTTKDTDINALYDLAIAQGADFVIGPLEKNKVETLAKRKSLPVSTLALNYTQHPEIDRVPENLYQFGLRAEDEVRQMAEHALSQGFKRAFVLTPSNDWGERLAQYFSTYWTDSGGVLLGSHAYEKGPAIGKTIQNMLDITKSQNRYKRMKSVLNQKLNFRPRRRQDIDVILVVASPVNGRLIKPQLAYHYADDIPMFSTSHIFDDQDSKQSNTDMDGVVFCETPWVLGGTFDVKSKFMQQWPEYPSNLKQFAALGVDAFKLHQVIQALEISPNLELKGATGTLFIKHNRSIIRRLPVHTFERGIPVPFYPEPIDARGMATS